MKAVYRPYCGGRTKRNGRTSSGPQRWRCTACGASTTLRYDDTASRLEKFLGWLLSKDSQAMMPGGGRSFRRRTAESRRSGRCPSPTASSTACPTSTGSGSRASSWCSYAAAARGWSLAHGEVGELEGVVGPHGADPGARRGRHRRRERVRQGRARDLAAHQGPEVHLPRPLAGQALHDDAAEAPGGARALPHRARPHGH